MEAAVGHHDLEPQGTAVGRGRLEGELVDGEAELVEPAHPGLDLVALVVPECLLVGQLLPQGPVALGDALGGGQVLLDPLAALPQLHGHVDQGAGHVLDQDVEVVGALAVAQDRVDLAGLGVDQERLEQLAVALEQGVGQRAVPPEHPLPVQVDQQAGDGVEQPVAVLDQLAGETPEQPPELP